MRILRHQQQSVRHDAIPTPRNESPFETLQQEQHFKESLEYIRTQGTIPPGYNLTRRELSNKPYPDIEFLPSRVRGASGLNIILPTQVWRPRAILWAQALQTATEIIENDEFVGFG